MKPQPRFTPAQRTPLAELDALIAAPKSCGFMGNL